MRVVTVLAVLATSWLLTLNSLKAEVVDQTCYSGVGGDYRGTVSMTTSGRTCQNWSVQTPHGHRRTPEDYPCSGLENNNYCRNPDGFMKPWCYTTDPQERLEVCEITQCVGVPEPEPMVPELSCFSCRGQNYRGTVSTTTSGRTCQSWSVQTPHRHGSTPEDRPHTGLENNNYCRNPTGLVKPWCLTTDPQERWEFCEIPRCVPDLQVHPTLHTADSDDVRLVGGASRCTGILEVRHQGDWKPAADFTSSWKLSSSSVACRQLGCGSAVKTTSHGSTHQPVWWITASCVGSESSLRECVTMTAARSSDRLEVMCSAMFSQCGRPEPRHTVKIVHGSPTLPGDHPWTVSLQSRASGSSGPFRHSCGGVLVQSCLVVTAAHCISPDRSQDMRVVVGGVYLRRKEDSEQVISVVRAIVHEDYRIVHNADGSFSAAHSDIALLQLNSSHPEGLCAVETRYVKTACLPERPFSDGKECEVSGWGTTGKGKLSNRLMEGRAPLISEQRCRAVYGERLDGNMICAGNTEEETAPGACKGDSGGPLMCSQDGVHYVAGVVSWGPPCDRPVHVGVYANVYSFLQWINSTDHRDYVYDNDDDATAASTNGHVLYDYTNDN